MEKFPIKLANPFYPWREVMRSSSYILRISLVVASILMLMAMPVFADAPYTPPQHPSNTITKAPAGYVPPAKVSAPSPSPKYVAATPVAPGLLPCPPCSFCGMYHPDPNAHKVPAPQLQNAAPSSAYAPSYVQRAPHPAPMQQAYAPAPTPAPTYAPAPGTYPVGGYVSNVPDPAGSNASLGEVWMRHGGARLQYDALRGPIQMNTNGRPVKDPALVHLPPLYPTPRRVARPAPTQPRVPKATAVPAAPKAPTPTAVNPSPRPVPKKAPQATVKPTFTDGAKPNTQKESVTTPPKSTADTNTTSTQKQLETQAPQEAVNRPISPTYGATPSPYSGTAPSVGGTSL